MTNFQQEVEKHPSGLTFIYTTVVPGVWHCLILDQRGGEFRGQGSSRETAKQDAHVSYLKTPRQS